MIFNLFLLLLWNPITAIQISQLQIERNPFEEGTSSYIYKAMGPNDSKYVLKISKSHKYNELLKKEYILSQSIPDHTGLVKMNDIYEVDGRVALLMEYMPQTLSSIVNPSLDFIKIISIQILKAIQYLHVTLKVLHNDIKPRNIYFSKMNDPYSIKLGDFGLVTRIGLFSRLGTRFYSAPELWMNKRNGNTKETDMWSFGMTLLTVVLGEPIFNDFVVGLFRLLNSRSDRKAVLLKERIQQLLSSRITDLPLRDFFTRLLSVLPEERLSITEALKHPFLNHFSSKI